MVHWDPWEYIAVEISMCDREFFGGWMMAETLILLSDFQETEPTIDTEAMSPCVACLQEFA